MVVYFYGTNCQERELAFACIKELIPEAALLGFWFTLGMWFLIFTELLFTNMLPNKDHIFMVTVGPDDPLSCHWLLQVKLGWTLNFVQSCADFCQGNILRNTSLSNLVTLGMSYSALSKPKWYSLLYALRLDGIAIASRLQICIACYYTKCYRQL